MQKTDGSNGQVRTSAGTSKGSRRHEGVAEPTITKEIEDRVGRFLERRREEVIPNAPKTTSDAVRILVELGLDAAEKETTK